jgi:hypothetical protein
MINLENGEKAKVISLHNRRLRKKYNRVFNLLNKICSFFCENKKNHRAGKDSYKSTVNH